VNGSTSRQRKACSLSTNSGLAELGVLKSVRSRITDFELGEGWGEGIRVYSQAVTPHTTLRLDLSPGRGEPSVRARLI